MGRRLAALAVLTALLVVGVPATSLPSVQNDGGSGGDAPERRGEAVPVEPGVTYDGLLTGAADDASDWYTVQRRSAGDVVHIRFSSPSGGCLRLVGPDGNPHGQESCRLGPFDGIRHWTLDEDGSWFLQVVPNVESGSPYRFSYRIDRAAPPTADALLGPVPEAPVPEDDAGSGRDAPDVQRDQIRVQPETVYEGNLTETRTTEPDDWYALRVRQGQKLQASISGGNACVKVVDPMGRWSIETTACATAATGSRTAVTEAGSAGTWFLQVYGSGADHYRFAVGVDGSAPHVSRTLSWGTETLPELPRPSAANSSGSHAVVAVVDSGINPYHDFFEAPNLTQHPSQWLEGFPEDARSVQLSLDAGGYDAAREQDRSTWEQLRTTSYHPREDRFSTNLYTFPGTRVVGALSFENRGDGPDALPVLDDDGHGTMTAGLAAGANTTSPEGDVLVVSVETDAGHLAEAIRWTGRQPWIDAVSVSWGARVAGVVPTESPRGYRGGIEWATLDAVRHGTPVLVSSGNGMIGTLVVPNHCSTFTNEIKGPSWVTRIGAAVEDDQPSWAHCIPVDAISRTNVPAPAHDSVDGIQEGTGTSASAPNAAARLAELQLHARERDLAVPPSAAQQVLLNASRPASPEVTFGGEPSAYPLSIADQGFGVVDDTSHDRALDRLEADLGPQPRPELDAFRRHEKRVRASLWGPGSVTSGEMWRRHVAGQLHDDAGSGRDAPDDRRPTIEVEPGEIYWGNSSVVGASGPHDDLYDNGDWYAFEGKRGQSFQLRTQACMTVVTPGGDRHRSLCFFGASVRPPVFTLPATGTYFLGTESVVEGPYRFSFTLDGSPPPSLG